MPSFIIKQEPSDEDFYVVWSTVTDSPHYWGTRAELTAKLAHKPDAVKSDRFARADQTGTSVESGTPPYLSWDGQDFFIVNNAPFPLREGHVCTLPRERLNAYCRALETNNIAAAETLVDQTPWED
ncbi:MAG: hypothetical protein LBK42_02040 [Propionibacteriaceae bacterium]|jgi:hypothetical protein|nr:hypothetical protein [Propionibacteriaceae bacterium]